MSIDFEKIPQTLRKLDQWVLWSFDWRTNKDGTKEKTKVPKQPHGRNAKTNNKETWSAFDVVKNAYSKCGFDGVGFCFTKDGGLCGVDLDACRNSETGEIADWAKKFLDQASTYSELSPSLTGIKLFCKGSASFKDGRKPIVGAPMLNGKAPCIEVYSGQNGRFFTVTSLRADGCDPEPTDETALLHHIGETHWKGDADDDEGEAPKKSKRKKKEPRPYNTAEWTPAAKRRRFDNYVKRNNPAEAVSNQRGHDKTYHFACLVVEHDLDDPMGAMVEYNRQCKPPWNDADLSRKLDEARKTAVLGSKLGVPPQKAAPGDRRVHFRRR